MDAVWLYGYLYLAAFGFLITLILTPLAKVVARRYSLFDLPGKRKIHAKPIPFLGGAAVFLSFALAILVNFFLLNFILAPFLPPALKEILPGAMKVFPRLLFILGGGAVIFVLGLVDDFKKISPFSRLAVQALVALVLFFAGVEITFFLPYTPLKLVLTVLWLVGITNAFNLLDNMDGLSPGVALIAVSFLFIVAFGAGQIFISGLLAVLAGCLGAFLIFNFHPASIFLGDSGSLFLGYILGVTSILSTYYRPGTPLFSAVMPLVILIVPIFDTLSVIVIRLKREVPIFQADKNHFSHRLVKLGMSRRQAVLFIYLVSATVGTSALFLRELSAFGACLVFLQALGVITIIILLEKAGLSA